MNQKDHPRTAERRPSRTNTRGPVPHGHMAGLTASPTSPRGNQEPDESRVRAAREDFARVLGN